MDRDWGFIGLVSASFLLGFLVAGYFITDRYTKLAIKNNCAYYDAKSGDFTWRESK